MAKVVIAGGNGMIGRRIENLLTDKKHDVYILTRFPTKKNHIAWNPSLKTLDTQKIQGTHCLINLSGENIASHRWTSKRKNTMKASRVGTTAFLFDHFHALPSLGHFISASGINCYPLSSANKVMSENEAFGSDYLSQLVKQWEAAADQFSRVVPVCKIRISMVLDHKEGALQKMLPLVKYGILSPLGNGKQWMNWVHLDDVAKAFVFAFENYLDGAFNVTGQPVQNIDFTKSLLATQGKKIRFPNIPAFLLQFILGEKSTIVLDGVPANNELLKEKGFAYQFENLQTALIDLFPR